MAREISAVLEYGAPEPGETATMMEDKLRFHTDSWDLSVDLRAGLSDIVVIDARSRDAYTAGHMPARRARRASPSPSKETALLLSPTPQAWRRSQRPCPNNGL
jgi:hypothetical protein